MLTAQQQTALPVFLMHEGQHPFCTRPGCFCLQHDAELEVVLRAVIAGKLQLRQVVNGTIVWEGSNGRTSPGS